MGKKVTGGKKAGGKAKRRAALTGLVYFAILALCIGALAMMPVINRAPDRQNTWVLQNSRANVSASAKSSDLRSRAPLEDDDAGDPGISESGGTGAGDASAADAFDGGDAEADGAGTPADVNGGEERASADAAGNGGGEDGAVAPDGTSDGIDEVDVAHLFDGGEAIADPAARSGAVTLTITAAGDCTLGGSVKQDTYRNFRAVVRKMGYDYFFEKVRDIFTADDLTILNLEGPLTDVGNARSGIYCFKGDPDFVQILSGSGVELCNVANNHSADFGVAGLKRTAEVLENAGVGCCGYTKVYSDTIKGVRVTALGFDKWQNDQEGIVRAIRRERENCDLLIVSMHWGREKHFEPMEDQVKWGHAAVSAGADLVIGTHPHVYGGVELYKGKYIVYSLGNFCFGGNDNPTDKRAMMFQQTFVVSPGGEVSDGGINVIPCYVSGRSDINNFQPVVMDAKAGASLLKGVAKYSNFSRDATLWMPDSYPERIGLLPKTEENLPSPADGSEPGPAEGEDGAV